MSNLDSVVLFFFQAEDGIRDLVRSRGLGDVYKRQAYVRAAQDRPLLLRPGEPVAALPGDGRFLGMIELSLIHI